MRKPHSGDFLTGSPVELVGNSDLFMKVLVKSWEISETASFRISGIVMRLLHMQMSNIVSRQPDPVPTYMVSTENRDSRYEFRWRSSASSAVSRAESEIASD